MSEPDSNEDVEGARIASEEAAPSENKIVKPTRGKEVSEDVVAFDEYIRIFPNKPIAKYNTGDVKAFHAEDSGGISVFALVCEPHLVPRVQISEVYLSFMLPYAMDLVGRGVVYWPPAKQERFVFIYKDPAGVRLMEEGGVPALGMKQDHVMNEFLRPLLFTLQDFKIKDFVHGSIRPSNIFKSGSGKKISYILGDCLSMPSGFKQPVLYETIERAMADPLGRGNASLADDVYAFGVSVAVLLRSHNSLEGMSDEEIVRYKMEVGSYTALTGKDRFKGPVLEFLRGVLHDDAAQRWTVEEIQLWLEGNRISPRQALRVKKAPRPIVFDGRKYMHIETLTMDLEKNTPDVLRLIESDDLSQWLERAFEDDSAVDRLEKAVQDSSLDRALGAEDRLSANISMALDKRAPLRYRGLKLRADAFGVCLSRAIMLGEDIKPYTDLLMSNMLINWVALNESSTLDKSALIGRLDSCRNYLRQRRTGFGLERCLYVLAPEVHCLSKKVEEYHVRSPEDLLRAFEDICSKDENASVLLDRHCAAFISVKDSRCIDPLLYEFDTNVEYKRLLGAVKSLAAIKMRSGDKTTLPNLCRGIAKSLSCVYARYHDRRIQGKLKENIERFAKEGDLVKIARVLDNADVVERDYREFRRAMIQYQDLSKEFVALEEGLKDPANFGRQTGKEFAAILSCLISGAIILIMSFVFLSGQGSF